MTETPSDDHPGLEEESSPKRTENSLSASTSYKVLGELSDASGAGVLGKNTAGSGTPIGVEGAVPNAGGGYGLSTPHDARVDGTAELAALAGSVTGGSTVTNLIGDGLTLDGDSLALTQSGSSGQILRYDGASWVLDSDQTAGAGSGIVWDGSGNHDVAAGNGLSVNSDSLDVNIGDGLTLDGDSVALTQSGLSGQILRYDGASWILDTDKMAGAGAGLVWDGSGNHAVGAGYGLSANSDSVDVNAGDGLTIDSGTVALTQSGSAGQVLRYDGSSWFHVSDSVTVNAGNKLTGGGQVSLGSSTTIDVQPTGAEVYLSSDQSYTSSDTGSWVNVNFDTVEHEDGSGWVGPYYETPADGDYQVDVNLNWYELDANLLEVRVYSSALGRPLMQSKTATSAANESIEMSKVLKALLAAVDLIVQVKYDGTGIMEGDYKHLSTFSVNKFA